MNEFAELAFEITKLIVGLVLFGLAGAGIGWGGTLATEHYSVLNLGVASFGAIIIGGELFFGSLRRISG